MHADAALQGSSIKSSRESDVRGRSFERNVDGEAEFVHAQVSADERGGAALAGEAAGDRAVLVHGEVSDGFFGTIGRGVGKLPFSADVPFRRLLGLLRLANRQPVSVGKNQFDLRFFLEAIAVGDDELGALSVFGGDRMSTRL